jgi:putative transposase
VSRYAFIARERHTWPVERMCRVLGVSVSGFYDWLKRTPSQRAQANTELTQRIRVVHEQSRQTYGYLRIHAQLHAEGLRVGKHRVARLMRQAGLRPGSVKRRRVTTQADERHAVAPNVLAQNFHAQRPNQKWLVDITYIATREGWLYLAGVLDVFSRRVVGWSMSAGMTAQLVTDALVMAIWRRGKPDALLHHSDRGSQYTSEQFQRLMADHGVVCSMSRSGNVWDNAAMESFFSSLKTERTAAKTYRSRDAARADVFDYIERFYNPRRRHSTLGYLSPVAYEERMRLA